MKEKEYPGGSKSRVNRAGDAVRNGNSTEGDLAAIEEWRAAHRAVLNTFQAILRIRLRGKNVIVAQRHKRKNTIFDKLQRLPKMQLARMDDVAGCRLIFKSIKEIHEFRDEFHKARFNHKSAMRKINMTISADLKIQGIAESTMYMNTMLIPRLERDLKGSI